MKNFVGSSDLILVSCLIKMNWEKEKILKRFEWLLDESKKMMIKFSKEQEVFYTDSDEVTSEELGMAITILKQMANIT